MAPRRSAGGAGSLAARGAPIPGVDLHVADVGHWATDHLGLIVAIVAVMVLIAMALVVVSLIAQGGWLARPPTSPVAAQARSAPPYEPARISSGATPGCGCCWPSALRSSGVHCCLCGTRRRPRPGWTQHAAWVVAPAVLVGLLLIVSGVIAGVVASIVVPYAQRAIAVLDIGPLAALREGWRVLQAHPGASLLVWLLNVALTFGAGLIVTVVMLVVVVALATPLAALWIAGQSSTPTALSVSIAYMALAAFAAIGVLLTLISVINTFFWSYWTLAYLRLRQ